MSKFLTRMAYDKQYRDKIGLRVVSTWFAFGVVFYGYVIYVTSK